jgi:hypothetical protein
MCSEEGCGVLISRPVAVCIAALLLCPFYAQESGANLLRNPGFETQGSGVQQAYYWEWLNPDNQGGSWGTATRENWNVFSGSWGGTIRGEWAGDTFGGFWQQVAANPGKKYRFTGWYWADGWWNLWEPPEEQGIKIEFFDVATNKIEEHVYMFFDVGPNWVRRGLEAISPTNTAWMRVVIFANNVGWDAALQFDDMELVELDVSTEIHPGPSSRRTGLVISEIMYHPPDRTDGKDLEYVELYNTTPFTNRLEGHRLSGSISYTFADDVVIPPFSYLVVAKEPASVQSVYGISGVLGPYEGRLPNSAGSVRLRKTPQMGTTEDAILLEVNYTDQPPWPLAADGGGHSLVLSEPSYGEDNPMAWSASIAWGGSPGDPEIPAASDYTNVVINEFLAHTDEPEWDYIELFNTATQAVNIGDCWLSDTASTNKFKIPAGTTIPARGYKVYFSVTNPPSASPTNLTFNLSSKGEDIFFRAPDGTVVDAVRFAAQENGVAMGRFPDGAADFHELASPSPGASNKTLRIRDVVINEIMYNPIFGDDNDQYIELHNWSGSVVDLSNWRLEDGITFRFPQGTTIPAGGYLVVAKNALHLMSNYPGVLNSGNTLGNFGGNLADSGERVVLVKPDDPNLPEQDFVIVDEVTYHDGGQWGEWSDGGGSSLELIDPRSDNRRASNWGDSDESGKSSWTLVQYTNVLDHGFREWWVGGTYYSFDIDELYILMLRRGECLVDNVEARRVGYANRIANPTFEVGGLAGWVATGNHLATRLTNEGYSSAHSMHVRASGGGDTGVNRIKTTLTANFSAGWTVELKARARWLRGDPNLLLRLRGNYLEASAVLPVPKNLGTPGQANSRKRTNVGPAIWDVSHSPAMPAAGEPVQVTARVHDPDGINYVRLRYRLDPSSTIIESNMVHIGGGVYRAFVPGQGHGQLVAFHVRARDAYSPMATNNFPSDAPVRECLVRFGDVDPVGDLGAYRFWMTKANIDEWKARERHSNEYLDTTFVNGRRIIYNAGIRWRGSPWIRIGMPDPEVYEWRSAFRVKFPADDIFLGMDELNLDSLERDRDTTLQRERMCYQIAEQLGLSASYQRYTFVCLNGVQYPYIYADSHHIERDYFRKWFPDQDDGELFKVDDWPEYRNFTDNFDNGGFEVRNATLELFLTTGGEKKKARYRWNWERAANAGFDDDYTGLFHLVDAGNLSNDQYTATLEAIADMRQWMRQIAFRHIVGDWDSYGYHRGKNTFMYRPNGGRWNLLPWDIDFGLGVGHDWNWDLFDVADYMPVIRRMVEHPPFRRYYWQALHAAVHGPLLSSRVHPVMDETYNALRAQGVAADGPGSPKSWVSNRRGYILSQLNPVTNFSLAVSSVTTNGNRITLSGVAPIQIHTLIFNGVEYAVTWSTVTNWSLVLAVTSGVNNIVVAGLDENGQQVGASVPVNVSYPGSDTPPEGTLVINEIMYQPADDLAEFLELHNRSANYAFDLAGYRMAGLDFTFQQGAVIAPSGFVLLVENRAAFAAVHTNLNAVVGEYSGKLDNIGERLQLLRPEGTNEVIVDEVIYDRAPPWPAAAAGGGPSLQLIDNRRDRNRVGNWAADTNVLYTPGAPNSVSRALPAFPLLWLNELQATNVSGIRDNMNEREPWLELYNAEGGNLMLTNFYLTDTYTNLVKWRFPAGAFAPGSGFRIVWLDNEAGETAGTNYHASFRPSTSTGSVALVYSNAGAIVIVDYMNYLAIPADRSYGSYPDGHWTNRMLFLYPTPGGTNNDAGAPVTVRINEWMTDNETFMTDPYGESDDWIELYNHGTNAVNLTDFGLTDNLNSPAKWRFPTGTIIQAGGFLLVWADNGHPTQTNGLHTSWALSKDGEAIGLYTPDGWVVDSLVFGPQEADKTDGRWPDASENIYRLAIPTPLAANIVSTNNSPPVMDPIGDQYGQINVQLSFVVTATDTDTPMQTLVFSLDPGAPSGAAIHPQTGHFTWTPGAGYGGTTNSVTIRVADNGYPPLSVFETFAIEVEQGNRPPVITPPGTVTLSPFSVLVLPIIATDPDEPGDVLTFSLVAPAPPGAEIGEYSGLFTWMPGEGYAASTNAILIRVRDDGMPMLSDTGVLTVVVRDMDQLFEADVLPAPAGGTNFIVRWSAESGMTYRVEYAAGLIGPLWTNLPGDVQATGSVAQKEDPYTNGPIRVYRIWRLLE